jgi:hypothetical protein
MRILPVGKAFNHVMSSTLNNLRFAFHSQWPWMLVWSTLLAGLLLTSYVALGTTAGLGDPAVQEKMRNMPGLAALFAAWVLVILVVGLVAVGSVAVNWHRYVLKDELPAGMARLRVDDLVWRYLGNVLLISMIAGLVAVPVAVIANLLFSFMGAFGAPFILAAVLLAVMPVFYRLSVKLPAIAMGRKDFSLRDAWQATQGNWWQIAGLAVWLTIISFAAALLLFGVTLLLQFLLPEQLADLVDLVVQLAANWVLTVFSITTLTSLYGFFVEGRDF